MCRLSIMCESIVSPPIAFANMLSNATVTCDYGNVGCKSVVPLQDLQYNTERCVYQSIAGDHCFSSVSTFPFRSHPTPVPIPDTINTETSNDETSRDRQNNICAVKAAEIVLQNVSAVHMLLQYEEMETTLVKKKIEANRSDDSSIKVKTKGQPLCLTYTPKPRKTTSEASTRTRRQRVLQLSQRRDIVSGGDAMLQLSERRCDTNKRTRRKILQILGLTPDIPPGAGLHLEVAMGTTWAAMRKLRRYFKAWHVNIGSEV
ncbi:uncharacterized protein [Ptychodera flava]|uniref:uncharacterized protein n=1 Tax=Ptychodera flava TaxID=63121 RepID=UPI00396A7B86